ncbi:acyltransferase [Anaeromyxobacter sp. PSR-1]|uniref:acyltransferase family protein n=1 Tax=Anaeromyxobacter sp. PSR-1 TaxID=1300915 RepID=UPI0005E934A9|nr:acyltransferase [Anaeromyxobacter sp. PSR-1]GAO02260.1 acyltransferase MdmB [Anaeromyxobacter sp. PSR-1]
MPSARDDRLAPLTGIRFAAALGILLFHYGGPLVAGAPAWARALQTGGYAWVSLFYVLSGFVLAWANPHPMDRAERRAFMTARLARLYPAYLLAFALSAPFALARWSGDGAAGLAKAAVVAGASLLLVHAWLPPISRLWSAPGWSTSAIATFYAVFPFATARLSRLSRRGLALALCAAWAASLALPLAYLALRPDGPGAELLRHEPRWLEALKFHPVARLGEFLAGVALGLLLRRGAALPRRLAGPAAALALAAAVAALAWSGFPYVLVHNGLFVPLWALLVAGLAGVASAGGALGRALSARPLQALGEASFALYALQDPLWRWAELLVRTPGSAASPGFVLGFSAFAVAVSLAVSRWLERPARRALRAALGQAPLAAARPPAP